MKDPQAEYVAFLERSGDKMFSALEQIKKLTEDTNLPIVVEINEIATKYIKAVENDNY